MSDTRIASPADDEDWDLVPLRDPLLRTGPILVLVCMIGSWILFAASADVVRAQIGRGTGLYGVLYGDPVIGEGYDVALAATCHWIGSLAILGLYWLDRPQRVRTLSADLEAVPGGDWIRARMAFPAFSSLRFCLVAVSCFFFVLSLSERFGERMGLILFLLVDLLPLTVLFVMTRARLARCIDNGPAILLIVSAAILPSLPLLACVLFPVSVGIWLVGLGVVFRWWWNVVPFP